MLLLEQCSSMIRMQASFLLTLKSIDQRLSKIEGKSTTKEMKYELIESFLPLEDIESIKNFEKCLLTNDAVVSQNVSIV